MKIITAYVWGSGRIEFGETCPDGALPVMRGDEEIVREAVSVMARYSRTNDDLLVPGIPEAADQGEALKALSRFAKLLKEHS